MADEFTSLTNPLPAATAARECSIVRHLVSPV
jgi:hypothetical protein